LKTLMKNLDLVLWIMKLKLLLITKQKLLAWGIVILLEKVLFKNSLIVRDLCLLVKRSILLDTNCYADAIVMLVEKLERKFVHIHPALQKVFYELPNINHPIAKKIATIILMREFDFIIQEARDIFAFYNKDVAHPPIEDILDKETMHSLESRDYQSYSKNLRRRVPYS